MIDRVFFGVGKAAEPQVLMNRIMHTAKVGHIPDDHPTESLYSLMHPDIVSKGNYSCPVEMSPERSLHHANPTAN